MKLCFIIFLLTTSNLFGQEKNANRTIQLLYWIVKSDHIKLLNTKTDISTFFSIDGDEAISAHESVTDSTNAGSKKCLMDFMSMNEVNVFCTKLKTLRQINWKDTHYRLPVKYYTKTFYRKGGKLIHIKGTFYGLSLPVFLNKEKTRALIGEYFTSDVAFGRGDLLLCENINSKWQVVARSVVSNE